MKPSSLLILVGVISTLSPSPVFSKSLSISDKRCVNSTLSKIEQTVLSYDQYRSVPGSLMQIEFPGFGAIKLIEMIKSQGRFLVKEPTQTDAVSWFVLRPVNLEDGKLYPRFLLSCQTTSGLAASHTTLAGAQEFSQTCKMVSDKEHFGLDGFSSLFTAKSGTRSCKPDQVRVQFNATLDSNSADVAAIKKKVLEPAGLLAPLLDPLFDEGTFFKSYYENVYEGWLKASGGH